MAKAFPLPTGTVVSCLRPCGLVVARLPGGELRTLAKAGLPASGQGYVEPYGIALGGATMHSRKSVPWRDARCDAVPVAELLETPLCMSSHTVLRSSC
jgi:hypothetical protein